MEAMNHNQLHGGNQGPNKSAPQDGGAVDLAGVGVGVGGCTSWERYLPSPTALYQQDPVRDSNRSCGLTMEALWKECVHVGPLGW